MTTENSLKTADSLKQICFNYITRPYSSENLTFWSKWSLFCLPFKMYNHVKNIVLILTRKEYQTVIIAKL